MVLLGIDRSRWNAEPNFAAFKAGGMSLIFCKATDGTGYKDPTFDACRAGAEGAGLVFGGYHFAEWGDPLTEADWFLSQATPRAGELVALDAEATLPAGVDPVAWSVAWSQRVHGKTGAWPLIYMNQSWLAAHNWGPVVALGDGLWLAKYDGAPTGGPVGNWPVMALKQFSSTATVPGETGPVDEDAFQGDLAALQKYTVPAPSSDWFAMATQDDLRTVIKEFFPANYSPAWLEDILRRTQSMHLYGFRAFDPAKTSPPPWTAGGDLSWLDTRQAELATAVTAGAHQPVTIDQAAADLIAASLVANPKFQQVVASAAAAVVAQMDADLANRFGPK
jgi:GH25 family lysozyme M1 (1,4-beta-N-acetylmuramidase)